MRLVRSGVLILAGTLAALGAGGGAVSSEPVTVVIKDLAYTPASVRVKVGQAVTWRNADDRDHTVAASDGSFASPSLSPGASWSWTFKSAGKFTYGCRYHPRMQGSVTVEP